MKKLFVLLCLLVITSIVLAGCGGRSRQTPTAVPTQTPAEPTIAPTEAVAASTAEPTAVPTEAPAEPDAAATEAAAASAEPGAPGPAIWTCPDGDRKVTIWHGWQDQSLVANEDVFKAYMAACPNVTIELVNKTDLSNALTAAVPAGEGPDIFAWVNDQIGRLADSGIIVPLNGLIDVDEFGKSFVPAAVAGVTYNGEIFGYPASMDALTMIYNKDLIGEEELPKTTDDLLRLARNWDKSDYYFVYNAKNDAYQSAPWWQAAGVMIIDEEGNTTFKSEGGYAAGNFIRALRDNNVVPEEIDYGIADTLFKEGKAAIIMNGPWYIQELDVAGINYGLAVLPIFSPTNTPAAPFVDVKALMLTKNAEDRGSDAAAVNVLQYYTSPEAQVYLAQVSRTVPTNLAAVGNPVAKALPVIATFGAQAANGKPLPTTPLMVALWEPMAKGLECIWTGAPSEILIQDCVDGIQQMAEENIAELR